MACCSKHASFRIKGVNAEYADMKLLVHGAEKQSRKVNLDEMCMSWRVHKGKVTKQLEGWSTNRIISS